MKNIEGKAKKDKVKHFLKKTEGEITEAEEEFCKHVAAGYIEVFDDEQYPDNPIEEEQYLKRRPYTTEGD